MQEERIGIRDALLNKEWEFDENLYERVQNNINKEEYTYKELCEVLELEKYGGNQKTAQIKELNRYMTCEYDKEKKRFIIGSKYDTPLPSLSNLPANTLYAQHIKIILLSYLLRHENSNPDGAIYISSQNLYIALGLVNRQYIEYIRKDKKKELREGLLNELKIRSLREDRVYTVDDIEDKTLNFYIKDFYDRCRSKFSSIIDTALNTLEKQNYITHSKAYHLYKRKLNEDNEVVETYFGGYSDNHETKDIMTIEREVMDEFGFVKDQDIWFSGRTEEYWDRVLELTQEIYPEIHALYRCHKILGTKTNILKALSREEETTEMHILNEKILNFIDDQAENKRMNSLNNEDKEKRLSRRYTDAQKYLSDKLIKIKE